MNETILIRNMSDGQLFFKGPGHDYFKFSAKDGSIHYSEVINVEYYTHLQEEMESAKKDLICFRLSGTLYLHFMIIPGSIHTSNLKYE